MPGYQNVALIKVIKTGDGRKSCITLVKVERHHFRSHKTSQSTKTNESTEALWIDVSITGYKSCPVSHKVQLPTTPMGPVPASPPPFSFLGVFFFLSFPICSRDTDCNRENHGVNSSKSLFMHSYAHRQVQTNFKICFLAMKSVGVFHRLLSKWEFLLNEVLERLRHTKYFYSHASESISTT